jgi:hypothetical protein
MIERIKDWFWNRRVGYDLRKAGIKYEVRRGPSFAEIVRKLAAEEERQKPPKKQKRRK